MSNRRPTDRSGPVNLASARLLALLVVVTATIATCANDEPMPDPTVSGAEPRTTVTAPSAMSSTTPAAEETAPGGPVSAPSATARQSGNWQIAYVVPGLNDTGDGHEQIYVVNTDGSQTRNLTNHVGNHIDPAWSPDGRQLAFISDRDGYQELYVMDAGGGNVRRLTVNDWTEQAPSWSPDGAQIAFDCYLPDSSGQADSRICLVGADGANPRILTEDINGYAPIWSPDSTQLAFTAIPGGFESVYAISADGTQLRPLTENAQGTDTYPAWSPDGEQLVYTSWRADGAQLRIIDADGSNDRRLTDTAEGVAPDWSPDGRRIAFVSNADNQLFTIYSVNTDGSQLREVVPSRGQSQWLAWSPDGSAIAFVAGGSLYVVNEDGADLRAVAEPVAALTAAWRPTADARGDLPPEPSATPTAAADLPTLEEVYARAAESLAQEGMVYHETLTVANEAGAYSLRGVIEQWVDANRNLVRYEATAEMTEATPPATLASVTIIANGERTTRDQNGEHSTAPAPTCYDTSAAVAAVLWCPGPTTTSTTVVEYGEWEGRPAIVLVETGTSSGSDERSTFVSRTYLDAESYLPIVRTSEGTLDYGQVVPQISRIDYTYGFIPADTLPADFFDPAAIGYTPPDLTAPLDRVGSQLTVYWLGERFEPSAELPPLVLTGVTESPEGMRPGYRGILDYRVDGATFGIVTLQQWPRAEWEASFGEAVINGWAARPCARQEDLELPIGRTIILMAWEAEAGATEPPSDCTAVTLNAVDAIVFAGETVIILDAPASSSIRDGYQPNPYGSFEGMLALVQGLQAR